MTQRANYVPRRGFVLIAVLGIIAALGSVTALTVVGARAEFAASQNRVLLGAALWDAIGCVNLRRAQMARALGERDSTASIQARWRELGDREGRRTTRWGSCDVTVLPTGTTLDVNSASDQMLLRYFAAAGAGEDRRDLVATLRDWLDTDTVARPLGAEAVSYQSRGLVPPRDGPVYDVSELPLILGFSDLDARVLAGLGVSPDPIVLTAASREVLMALPGIGPRLAESIRSLGSRRDAIYDLRDLERLATPIEAEEFRAHFPALASLAELDPSTWLVRVRVTRGSPPITRVVEARLVLDGSTPAIARWTLY